MSDLVLTPVAPPPATVPAPAPSLTRFPGTGPGHPIDHRPDGVYADLASPVAALRAAVDAILGAGGFFAGLDYQALVQALYGGGPAPGGEAWLRLAEDILPFDAARRVLYRSVKIRDGEAEYCFEPVFLPGPGGEGEVPTQLDLDEFIADMWSKGIRFGIDAIAVAQGVAHPNTGRIVVARRLEPLAGQDASVVEVSDEIHRSDAPRQLANGKLDLMSFQNRFPQVDAGTCLLQKLPPRPGKPGFDLSGIRTEPAAPNEFDFTALAGSGTRIERLAGGEYLVATRTGFLNVDPKTQRVSIDDKVVSRDGVSARTTGNLQLSGDYEEFGEVQEKRVIEGNSITVHADVYGEVVSRGGSVLLRANLVGGSAHNKRGDIRVDGVTSNAVIAATAGDVTLARAESCVVSGTRVRIEEAVNCEIVADEVTIGLAEGCAVAARRVAIESSAPWRESEMVVWVLCADCARVDEVIAQIGARLDGFDALLARYKAELAQLCAQPALRQYLDIAGRVRSGALSLAPAQEQQFRQMGRVVAADLQKVAEIGAARKALGAERAQGQVLLERFTAERAERAGTSVADIALVQGETGVRRMAVDPDGAPPYRQGAREIRAWLRGSGGERLGAVSQGSYRWSSGAAPGADQQPGAAGASQDEPQTVQDVCIGFRKIFTLGNVD